MKQNVGQIDRGLRALLGLVLILAPLVNMPAIWSSVGLVYLSMAVGIVMLLTSAFGSCPLYRVIGIATNKAP